MTDLDPYPYLEQLRPGLIPIAGAQPGVCGRCRSGKNAGYPHCYPCSSQGIVTVLPISMSVHGGPLHSRLRHYKDGNDEQKLDFSLQLAALLGLFLRFHANCIGGMPDIVTTVCSSQRDAPRAIVRKLRSLRDSHLPLRFIGTSDQPRYEASEEFRGQRVLLIDDTFTRGRSITAAYRALVDVGATILTPLVLGRHVRPDFPTSEPLLSCLLQHRWSLDRCGICQPIDCEGIADGSQLF